MSNKKELTPVEWLIKQVKSKEFINDMYPWHKEEIFKKALEMEEKNNKNYTVKKGEVINCLTPDGWETGVVKSVNKDTVTVFMHYIGAEKEFTLNLIKP